jgi:hypothetical protein
MANLDYNPCDKVPFEPEGITLSSSSSAQSSSDSSFAQSKSLSQELSSEPKSDSVNSSDHFQEPDPEGISLDELDKNPNFVDFRNKGGLVGYEVALAAARAFHRHSEHGFVGAELGAEGYGAPILFERPEGVYASAEEGFKNPELLADAVEAMVDWVGEFCFVSADYAEFKKVKNDPKSLKRLWNSTNAKNLRKELKVRQEKAAREMQLAKKRKSDEQK